MSDPLIEMPLSAKELRGANYAATQTLRGGETIYKGNNRVKMANSMPGSMTMP
ncbi:MAG: hypothetical protein OXC84_14960 [Gammaproteobacteria bacterium]|nr:hypothetical protein [Gammaproteobacteria bacterium]